MLVDMPSTCYYNTLGGWGVRNDGDIIQSHNLGTNFAYADGHVAWMGNTPIVLYTYNWLAPRGIGF
jgi:prepilin-type processing-associated H-X9-DG protein